MLVKERLVLSFVFGGKLHLKPHFQDFINRITAPRETSSLNVVKLNHGE